MGGIFTCVMPFDLICSSSLFTLVLLLSIFHRQAGYTVLIVQPKHSWRGQRLVTSFSDSLVKFPVSAFYDIFFYVWGLSGNNTTHFYVL